MLITSPAARKFFAAFASPEACKRKVQPFCQKSFSQCLSFEVVLMSFMVLIYNLFTFNQLINHHHHSHEHHHSHDHHHSDGQFVISATWIAFALASLAASASAAIARWKITLSIKSCLLHMNFQSNFARWDFKSNVAYREYIFKQILLALHFQWNIAHWDFESSVVRRKYIFNEISPLFHFLHPPPTYYWDFILFQIFFAES